MFVCTCCWCVCVCVCVLAEYCHLPSFCVLSVSGISWEYVHHTYYMEYTVLYIADHDSSPQHAAEASYPYSRTFGPSSQACGIVVVVARKTFQWNKPQGLIPVSQDGGFMMRQSCFISEPTK